ncbi:MAG TPA: MOSC domain-containing protein [Planctomycetota bacterium]|jgi:MOSC domain-containing protein YiiM|nr:MOSC domain-containing protein [Planctomycetota bacterium]
MWKGVVVSIQVAARGGAALAPVAEVRAVAGRGLVGDRYHDRRGTYSERPGNGRSATLIETETLEALRRDHRLELSPAETRRNFAIRDVPLNHLVGRRFRVGEVLLEGVRLCEPCLHLESLTRSGVREALVHRGGLRAEILSTGTIRVGDSVRPEPEPFTHRAARSRAPRPTRRRDPP